MSKVYPGMFYMTVYEDFKRVDGTESYYSRLMFNPATWAVGDRMHRKSTLKEAVDEKMSHVIDLEYYSCTETEFGWQYERFVKWEDNEQFGEGENVVEGEHTDHEVYVVEIDYYRFY